MNLIQQQKLAPPPSLPLTQSQRATNSPILIRSQQQQQQNIYTNINSNFNTTSTIGHQLIKCN